MYLITACNLSSMALWIDTINVLSSIEYLKCIRFEDGGIEDYQCVEELINILEIIFGGLENYKSMDDIKEILDVKEIINYARKNR